MKKLKKYFKGFTLVELIIVITILAILGTIAFVSFQSYMADARDANRLSTISSVQKGLELYHAKSGVLPEPDNTTTYTGGTNTIIKQGLLSENVSRMLNISSIPKDPLTSNKYYYSISGNGQYYQIGTDKENMGLGGIFDTAYAEVVSTLVKGNYTMDPSLPSLLVVSGSINSGSGIFDPNVCFIINGGVNNFGSTSGNCIKKRDLNLKSYDSSLVGYWDMETTFNSGGTFYLKDLSGNGNDGECIDRNGATSTSANCQNKLTGTGKISKSMQFSFDGSNISNIVKTGDLSYNGTSLIDYSKGFSINILYKEDITTYTQTPLYHYNYWFHRNPSTGFSYIRSYSFSGELLNNGESSCRPVHPICINNMAFLKDYSYIPTNFNLHTIIFDTNFKYYINGVRIYTLPIEKTVNTKNISPFYIGGTTTYTSAINGIIDDVKIYNRALSDEEIKQQARIAGF